jgi:hypothetical protein
LVSSEGSEPSRNSQGRFLEQGARQQPSRWQALTVSCTLPASKTHPYISAFVLPSIGQNKHQPRSPSSVACVNQTPITHASTPIEPIVSPVDIARKRKWNCQVSFGLRACIAKSCPCRSFQTLPQMDRNGSHLQQCPKRPEQPVSGD